jgi:ABC-type transport system involved in multi-copper enzyme maturation permease subunit
VEALREIAIVARAETGRTFRSARIIVLFVLYAMFSGLVLLVVGAVANAINQQIQERLDQTGAGAAQGEEVLGELRRGFLGVLVNADPAMIEALGQIPLVVLIVFKLTLFFLPAYVALMGFDQVSGEVGSKSIRYLTIRARRSSVLFGKFAAQAAVLLALVLAIDVAVFAYARGTNEAFGGSAMLAALLRFCLAAIVFSLAYLSLTTLCSTLFRSPAVSLVFNFIALFALWLVNAVGMAGVRYEMTADGMREQVTSALAYLRYFTPSHYSNGLLHPAFGPFAASAGAFAGFAALFLIGAWAVMRARDV